MEICWSIFLFQTTYDGQSFPEHLWVSVRRTKIVTGLPFTQLTLYNFLFIVLPLSSFPYCLEEHFSLSVSSSSSSEDRWAPGYFNYMPFMTKLSMRPFYDKVTEWQSDKVTKWQSDKVTVWQCDSVTAWQCDRVTEWKIDGVKKWQIDRVKEWWSDGVTEWQLWSVTECLNDRYADWETYKVGRLKNCLQVLLKFLF